MSQTVLLHDGGEVLSAISASPSHLQGFIRNANTVFAATAARTPNLRRGPRVPAFIVATRETIARLNTFAASAGGRGTPSGGDAAQPGAHGRRGLAPSWRHCSPSRAARRLPPGRAPSLEHFLSTTDPLLDAVDTVPRDVVPIIDYLNAYQARDRGLLRQRGRQLDGGRPSRASRLEAPHYCAPLEPAEPGVADRMSSRPSTNRFERLHGPRRLHRAAAQGLAVFGSYLCTNNPFPKIGPTIPGEPGPILTSVYYGGGARGGPACRAQAPLSATLARLPGLSSLTSTFPTLESYPDRSWRTVRASSKPGRNNERRRPLATDHHHHHGPFGARWRRAAPLSRLRRGDE